MKSTRILQMILAFVALIMLSQTALAASRTITAGNVEGNRGDIVSVPVTIDDPSGIGGVNLTLQYDANVLEFLEVESELPDLLMLTRETNATNATGTTSLGMNTRTYQGIVVALITANDAFPSSGNLFNATFRVKETITADRTLSFDLVETVVNGQKAQVLASSSTGASLEYDLQSGSCEVEVPKYTLSGTIRDKSSNATLSDCQLVLRQDGAIVGVTTSDENGEYTFQSLVPAGYSLLVTPRDPRYGTSKRDMHIAQDTSNFNLLLSKAEAIAGTVAGIDGLKGVKIRLVVGGEVVGLYNVAAADGSFVTAAVHPDDLDTARLIAIYGNVEKELTAGDGGSFTGWENAALYGIGGKITGLADGVNCTIDVVSQTGKLQKTITATAPSYQILDLVPAPDYVVSIATPGNPLMYYDKTNSYYNATLVAVSNATVNATDMVAGIDFDFTTVSKGTIAGTVTKGSAPVSGEMIAFNTGNQAASWTPIQEDDGSYSINLEPGDYELFVFTRDGTVYYYAGSNATTQNANDAESVALNANDNLTRDFKIPASEYSIQGMVMDKRTGLGYPGALVTARQATTTIDLTISNADGSYELDGLPDGNYTVVMNPLSGNGATQTRSAEAGDRNIDFMINTKNIVKGRVINTGDAPVKKATIQLLDRAGMLVGSRMYYSDSNGTYTIKDVPSGIFVLHVSHDRYQPYTRNAVDIEQDTTLEPVVMEHGGGFQGTVSDNATQAALSGASVVAVGTNSARVTRTGSDGGYEFNALTADTLYTLSARKNGYVAQYVQSNATTGNGTLVDFDLAKVANTWTVNGTVKDADTNQPITDADMVLSSPGKGIVLTTTANANGVYAFQNVPESDDYRLFMIPSGDLAAQSKNVAVDQNKQVDFTLSATTAVSGTVSWNNGGPAYVFLYSSDGSVLIGYHKLDSTGSAFTFSGLVNGGTYRLVAAADGKVETTDVEAPSSNNTLDLIN
jgi:hypothetical protein